MTCLQLALMQSTCQEMAMEQGGERDLRLGDDKFSQSLNGVANINYCGKSQVMMIQSPLKI